MHLSSLTRDAEGALVRTSKTINVILVEDQLLIRHATRLLIQQDPDVRVVGEADGVDDALSLTARCDPDIAVIDIRLKNSNGVDLAKSMKKAFPWVKVLALTAFDHDQYVRAMARAGVEAYLLKQVSGAELIEAIHCLHEGRPVPHSEFLRLDTGHGDRRGDGDAHARRLTAREMEILEMLQGSLTNQQIAQRLGVSSKTVYTHITHILGKLGQPSWDQAVDMAVRRGLISRISWEAADERV